MPPHPQKSNTLSNMEAKKYCYDYISHHKSNDYISNHNYDTEAKSFTLCAFDGKLQSPSTSD